MAFLYVCCVSLSSVSDWDVSMGVSDYWLHTRDYYLPFTSLASLFIHILFSQSHPTVLFSWVMCKYMNKTSSVFGLFVRHQKAGHIHKTCSCISMVRNFTPYVWRNLETPTFLCTLNSSRKVRALHLLWSNLLLATFVCIHYCPFVCSTNQQSYN